MAYLNGKKVYDTINVSVEGTHTYSTSEQVVGEWIDGKSVYELTAQATISSSSSIPSVDMSAYNIDEIIEIKKIWFDNDGFFETGDGYTGASKKSLYYDKSDSTINFELGSGISYPITCTYTVRYTKTTD